MLPGGLRERHSRKNSPTYGQHGVWFDARVRLKACFAVDSDSDIRGDFMAPLFLEEIDVSLFFAEPLGPTLGLIMNHHAVGLINDPPSLLTKTEAKIHILVTVPESFVKATHFLEHDGAGQQAGTSTDVVLPRQVGLRQVGRLLIINMERADMPGGLLNRDDYPGVLDGPIGEEQLAAHSGRGVILLEYRE